MEKGNHAPCCWNKRNSFTGYFNDGLCSDVMITFNVVVRAIRPGVRNTKISHKYTAWSKHFNPIGPAFVQQVHGDKKCSQYDCHLVLDKYQKNKIICYLNFGKRGCRKISLVEIFCYFKVMQMTITKKMKFMA